MKHALFSGAALVAALFITPAVAQDTPCNTVEECARVSIEIAKQLSERQAAIETRLRAQATIITELTAALEAEQATSQSLTERVAQLEACAVKTDELTFTLTRNENTGSMRHDLGTIPDTATIWFSNSPSGPWWLMDSIYTKGNGGYGTWLTDVTSRTLRLNAGVSPSSSYGTQRTHYVLFNGSNAGNRYFRVILTARATDRSACESE